MTPRGGSAPQVEGQTFEELLDWIHKGYLARGRAAIYHNKVAGKFIRQGQFIPDPALARPDYSGTLAGGISVHFDAKTMADTCGWRLPKESLHQYEELLEQARMGAVAFFLVECRLSETVYLLRVHPEVPIGEDGRPGLIFADVPVADWRLEKHADHRCKHRAITNPAFCVPAVDGTYDWLTAVERFWLSRSTIAPQPVGRPSKNNKRDEQIRKLAKTHTSKSLQKDFHLGKERINQIIRGGSSYLPRAVRVKS